MLQHALHMDAARHAALRLATRLQTALPPSPRPVDTETAATDIDTDTDVDAGLAHAGNEHLPGYPGHDESDDQQPPGLRHPGYDEADDEDLHQTGLAPAGYSEHSVPTSPFGMWASPGPGALEDLALPSPPHADIDYYPFGGGPQADNDRTGHAHAANDESPILTVTYGPADQGPGHRYVPRSQPQRS